MSNAIEIKRNLVSVDWLMRNFEASNLIIFDATIKKVTANNSSKEIKEKKQIKNARFLDIKNKFSDISSEFPNALQSPQKFEEAARQLGIENNSAIVVYDDLGIYSSARIWWLFKAMGHHNVAVLDGGFPTWEKAELPIEKALEYFGETGNFIAKYNANYMNDFNDVFDTIDNDNILVLDARSENRFNGTEPEPREGLRSGHIPNSINLPYSKLIENNKMKSKEKLKSIFSNLVDKDNELIFSCGSGITACILALGAEIAGFNNKSVYDGSWTEWGALSDI